MKRLMLGLGLLVAIGTSASAMKLVPLTDEGMAKLKTLKMNDRGLITARRPKGDVAFVMNDRFKKNQYVPSLNIIEIRPDADNNTMIHELGHAVDDHIDPTIDRTPLGHWSKMESTDKAVDSFYKVMDGGTKYREVSDILSAESNGELNDMLPWQHSKEYWNDDRRNKEVFAELYVIMATNDIDQIEVLNDLCPGLYDYYITMFVK